MAPFDNNKSVIVKEYVLSLTLSLTLSLSLSLSLSVPDRVAQSVACLIQEPEVPGSIPGPAKCFRFSFRCFKKALSLSGFVALRVCVPGRVAQSVARRTQEPEVPGSKPGPAHAFVSPSANSRRAIVSYWRKYVH